MRLVRDQEVVGSNPIFPTIFILFEQENLFLFQTKTGILNRRMEESVKRSPFEKRIHEIDFLRGLLMVLVVLDHVFNLLMSFNKVWAGGSEAILAGEGVQPFVTIYKVAAFYWTNPARYVVRWLCLATFCFVSGISCAFSRNNWKRAGQMIGLWFFILVFSNIGQSLITHYNLDLGIATARVDFNIIGVLAWSTLAYCFVQDKSWKALLVVAIVGLAIHPICVLLSWTEWGQSPDTYAIPLWKPTYTAEGYGPYRQADFMPLFPYISFFFGGAILSKFTYSVHKESYFKRHEWERPICFLGRHSLIVYISHFLILIGIFSLVGLFIK